MPSPPIEIVALILGELILENPWKPLPNSLSYLTINKSLYALLLPTYYACLPSTSHVETFAKRLLQRPYLAKFPCSVISEDGISPSLLAVCTHALRTRLSDFRLVAGHLKCAIDLKPIQLMAAALDPLTADVRIEDAALSSVFWSAASQNWRRLRRLNLGSSWLAFTALPQPILFADSEHLTEINVTIDLDPIALSINQGTSTLEEVQRLAIGLERLASIGSVTRLFVTVPEVTTQTFISSLSQFLTARSLSILTWSQKPPESIMHLTPITEKSSLPLIHLPSFMSDELDEEEDTELTERFRPRRRSKHTALMTPDELAFELLMRRQLIHNAQSGHVWSLDFPV